MAISGTVRQWRQQARTLHALERIAMGDSVTAAALACGYESVSAFTAAFLDLLRATPARYFDCTSAGRHD